MTLSFGSWDSTDGERTIGRASEWVNSTWSEEPRVGLIAGGAPLQWRVMSSVINEDAPLEWRAPSYEASGALTSCPKYACSRRLGRSSSLVRASSTIEPRAKA
ncbi:hypothetical protein RSO01_71250 [Reyranella soli]|uniref:Uncharacterized protein n=1 Tax=Reyranella soli TaxID=1230389 RepID=A0A512NM14_9HYPH|nr:hypothetical protein RSO01_71250 [Reyranella soli]